MRCYSLPNSIILRNVQEVSDLGICMSENFSFEAHINQIASKANMKISWILSVFESRDPELMLTLFKSLVLNIVEYCSPLWSPHKIQEIAKIEGVQRRFTSRISSLAHLNYWDRLKKLKLYSLQRRRERFILIYVWKIIHERVPNDVGIAWRICGRKGIIAAVPRVPSAVAKINTSYDYFFKVNATKLWNCLPKSVNTVDTMEPFKRKLDLFLKNISDFPPVSGYTTMNSNSLLDWLGYSNAF